MKRIFKKRSVVLGILIYLAAFVPIIYSHCQIPCGIYDDKARFAMIAENIITIEKSMKAINDLSKQKNPDMNQFVRWIHNKEQHAERISRIVSYYFLAQRIKPVEQTNTKDYKDYITSLTLLHKMLVYSMKCKQTTELENVEKLRELLAGFKDAYYENHAHKH